MKMKIDELIAELQKIRKDNGNVEVYITNLGTGLSGIVSSIDFDNVVQINAKHIDKDLNM